MEIKECYVDVNWRVPINNRKHRFAHQIGEELYIVFVEDNPYNDCESMIVHKSKIERIWYTDFNQIWSNI